LSGAPAHVPGVAIWLWRRELFTVASGGSTRRDAAAPRNATGAVRSDRWWRAVLRVGAPTVTIRRRWPGP